MKTDREIELLIQRKLNKAKKLKKLTNVMAVIGIICVIITLTYDMIFLGIVWLIAMAIVVKITITDSKTDIESDKRIAAAFNELASYDKNTRILTVNRRSTLIAHLITIEETHDVDIKYEPIKLHVGSVTNGGITSGGAFTTGGYNYIDSARKNGLCTMNYKGMSISSIQLTNEIYEIASQSSIACYLDSPQQQIIVEHKKDDSILNYGFEQYQKTGYIGNIAANAGKPTVEKGMMILEWLATP